MCTSNKLQNMPHRLLRKSRPCRAQQQCSPSPFSQLPLSLVAAFALLLLRQIAAASGLQIGASVLLACYYDLMSAAAAVAAVAA